MSESVSVLRYPRPQLQIRSVYSAILPSRWRRSRLGESGLKSLPLPEQKEFRGLTLKRARQTGKREFEYLSADESEIPSVQLGRRSTFHVDCFQATIQMPEIRRVLSHEKLLELWSRWTVSAAEILSRHRSLRMSYWTPRVEARGRVRPQL